MWFIYLWDGYEKEILYLLKVIVRISVALEWWVLSLVVVLSFFSLRFCLIFFWEIHYIEHLQIFRKHRVVLSIISIVDCDAGRRLTLCSCCFGWKFSIAKFIRLCCSPFHWKISNISNYHSFPKLSELNRILWCSLDAYFCSVNTGCLFSYVVVFLFFALNLTLVLFRHLYSSSFACLLATSNNYLLLRHLFVEHWKITLRTIFGR